MPDETTSNPVLAQSPIPQAPEAPIAVAPEPVAPAPEAKIEPVPEPASGQMGGNDPIMPANPEPPIEPIAEQTETAVTEKATTQTPAPEVLTTEPVVESAPVPSQIPTSEPTVAEASTPTPAEATPVAQTETPTPAPVVETYTPALTPVSEPVPAPVAPTPAQVIASIVTPAVAPVIAQTFTKSIHELFTKAQLAIQNRKRKKIDRVMTLFAKQTKITNNEVEKLLHISDSTATRYLATLEKEGKIKQNTKKGHTTSYSKI